MKREEVFDLQVLIGLQLSAATAEGCAALGLTATEARVISCLATHGPRRPGAIGAELGVSPRRMTQVTDSLDAKMHAVRDLDPLDARARILRLTPSGALLATQIDEMRTAWAEDLLSDVPGHDLSVLASSLTSILRKLTS